LDLTNKQTADTVKQCKHSIVYNKNEVFFYIRLYWILLWGLDWIQTLLKIHLDLT